MPPRPLGQGNCYPIRYPEPEIIRHRKAGLRCCCDKIFPCNKPNHHSSCGTENNEEARRHLMYGHEKSDLVIVAAKPANKAKEAHCGGICGGRRSGVGGAKDGGQGEYASAKHVLDSEPGSRETGAGAYTATC